MTIQLFLFLLTIGSTVSSLLTEALKKSFTDVSTNVIALINACIVGIIGTICAYILLDIQFTLANDVCIFLMAVCVWLGSMVGFDKLKQTFEQIKG